MNNYNRTFSDFKRVSDYINIGYEDKIVEYLNSFDGDNIHEKFKNILAIWEKDVSYTLSFNVKDVPTKVQLSYILTQFRDISDAITFTHENMEMTIGIPDQFEIGSIVPIYTVLHQIKFSGITVDLTKLLIEEKTKIIDNLPASIYVAILDVIMKEKNKYLSVDMEFLKDFKINFMSNSAYMFLKGLFSNFDDYYFMDVIFHLSKRIDGSLLMNSTPLEIQYYIERYSKEMESGNGNLAI